MQVLFRTLPRMLNHTSLLNTCRNRQDCNRCSCKFVGADGQYFKGRKVEIRSEVESLANKDFDNRIESIQTQGDCRWLAYQGPNFEVYTYILESSKYYSKPSSWGGRANEIWDTSNNPFSIWTLWGTYGGPGR